MTDRATGIGKRVLGKKGVERRKERLKERRYIERITGGVKENIMRIELEEYENDLKRKNWREKVGCKVTMEA